MTFEVFEGDGTFDVVGRLVDDRPWATGRPAVERVHEMTLSVTVRRSDLTIAAARAEMARFPHAECPDIEPAFDALVGLCVARGFARAVQERFGRELGCTHLELLARCLGPVVIQAVASAAARLQDPEQTRAALSGSGSMFENSCHVWATGGPGMDKIAMGWVPNAGEYPAPSAVELRARRR